MDVINNDEENEVTRDDNVSREHGKRWGAAEQNQNPPVVLEPDHPLMQKFQITYKKCLEKELERINTEILEQRENLKKNKQNYERQMGEEMFNLEQAVSQQRKSILECEESLDKAAKIRAEKDEIVREKRQSHKKHLDKLNEEKRKDAELLGELEALSLLCKQYESWQKDTDSELTLNQRISEKLSAEKQILAQEKKKMDLMVYNLTTEVWKLESQIELIEDQMQIKSQELETIKGRTSDSNADLQALNIEQKHLMQLWNSVIVNIQQKDKMHAEINADYENVQNELKTIVATVETIKKEIEQAMHQHEKVTAKKDKAAYDLAECTKAVEREEEQRLNIERAIIETTTALEMTENDLHTEQFKNIQNQNTIKSLTQLIEKLSAEKISLENDTLDKLQEQLTCDKATRDIATKIKQLKEISRNAEISMIKNENQNAKLLLKIERQKIINSQKLQMSEEERNICKEKEAELNMMENKLKENIFDIEKKQTNLDIINKKIGAFLEKTGGKEMSPVERKIEELEKDIEHDTKKIKELQQDWLRMQGHIVQLSRQYQRNIADVNLTKEQIQIMECKLMKLENTINKQKMEENKMLKSLDLLQIRIDQLSKQTSEDKNYNQELEKKYNDLTLDHMTKLKDSEMKVMGVEEELSELEEEKVQLAIELHKHKREVLSWEKMEILALEAKQKVDEEKSATGEIGRMKMEIHRMRVRHGQVTSTSARLASDLAQTVWRREAAVGRARACSQSVAPRHTFLSKIKEKRSDIRRLNQEIDMNKNIIEKTERENRALESNINEKMNIILGIENEIDDLKRQIEDCQLSKQKNLERIIRNQRYGQHCTSILSGQTRVYSIKSAPAINIEYDKQKQVNSKMIRLVQKLLEDLPDQNYTLMRILNTLNVDDDQ